ncbi:CAP domain-containing protein [Actinoplanes sp. NPDC026670]|uniref:CAP domain-containing protein n=1 Tax=Actinoplanes sp. NPDC026670 TaxID=3154700 RepID=UPI0033E0D616
MRQLLRRLAVTAVLAPVAAIGVTTMFASQAEAAPAKSHPWPGQDGQHGPGHHGGWKHRGPAWPGPQMPFPGMPAPEMPYPGMPAPEMPFPGMPAPEMPAPEMPAPATPAPEMPAPAPGDATDQGVVAEINRLINEQRASNKCEALTVNDQLTAAASGHSAWMAQNGTLSHTGDGGSTFVTRAQAAGYAQPSAENIAMGYRTAAEVVDGWMNSPGHRANIVNCKSKTVGVAVADTADGTPYYTQVFGY